MTAQYIIDNPSEKNTSHAALLQTKIQEPETKATFTGLLTSHSPPKYVFPTNRLPRNSTDIANMSDDNPVKLDFEMLKMQKFSLLLPWVPGTPMTFARKYIKKSYWHM